MRRSLLVLLALPLSLGCRAPAIPSQLTAREYAVYDAFLDQASIQTPGRVTFAVDSTALTPNQNELQFHQCLPPRMENILDTAPESTLAVSSATDWLSLSDGRPAQLHPHEDPLQFAAPTELFRFSRVAFTRLGYHAYFWVEHRTCLGSGDSPCEGASGALVHGRKANGSWTFEETTCQAMVLGS